MGKLWASYGQVWAASEGGEQRRSRERIRCGRQMPSNRAGMLASLSRRAMSRRLNQSARRLSIRRKTSCSWAISVGGLVVNLVAQLVAGGRRTETNALRLRTLEGIAGPVRDHLALELVVVGQVHPHKEPRRRVALALPHSDSR